MHPTLRVPLTLLTTFVATFAVTATLWLVPAEAAFYSASLHNREQFEVIANSKAWAKLKSLPAAKLFWAKVQEDLAKPGAEGAAAVAKADALAAKARRASVRYLGTLDCRYYPEAEAALIAALRTDGVECVRWEAAMALGRSCCCNRRVMAALTTGLDFWSCSMSRTTPVVSTLATGLAAPSQVWSAASLAAKASRTKPSSHCWSSRKASALLARSEPALLSAETAKAWVSGVLKSSSHTVPGSSGSSSRPSVGDDAEMRASTPFTRSSTTGPLRPWLWRMPNIIGRTSRAA